jgi:hypothetical protein
VSYAKINTLIEIKNAEAPEINTVTNNTVLTNAFINLLEGPVFLDCLIYC